MFHVIFFQMQKLYVLLVYAAPLHHMALAANVVLHLHHQVEVSPREVLHEGHKNWYAYENESKLTQ